MYGFVCVTQNFEYNYNNAVNTSLSDNWERIATMKNTETSIQQAC